MRRLIGFLYESIRPAPLAVGKQQDAAEGEAGGRVKGTEGERFRKERGGMFIVDAGQGAVRGLVWGGGVVNVCYPCR